MATPIKPQPKTQRPSRQRRNQHDGRYKEFAQLCPTCDVYYWLDDAGEHEAHRRAYFAQKFDEGYVPRGFSSGGAA